MFPMLLATMPKGVPLLLVRMLPRLSVLIRDAAITELANEARNAGTL